MGLLRGPAPAALNRAAAPGPMLLQGLDIQVVVLLIPVLLFSLTFHEFAHAATAYVLGDDTAQRQGRMTLNPLVHLDPFGTLMLLFAGFGYAKPVPVDPRNLRRPRRDDILVSAAGPASNFLLAILAAVFLHIWISGGAEFFFARGMSAGMLDDLGHLATIAVFVNVTLAFFNLLPIYPLDGSHVVENMLPPRQAEAFRESARYSIIVLLAILLIDPVAEVVFTPARWLTSFLLG